MSAATKETARQGLIKKLYAKLDEEDLPGHVFGRISASITQLEKLEANENRDAGGPAVVDELGPALSALPPEHASAVLVDEIRRLDKLAAGYRSQLAELVGPEAAGEALG